ncbi:MAG: glycosyltransferase family 39 protein [Chloroflexota bacterium]
MTDAYFTRASTQIQENKKIQFALLGLTVLLGAALRFYKLGEWSLWIDEIFTINRVQAHYSSLELMVRHIPPHTNWVPLSLLLTSGPFALWGASEWSVRLVPAIIGVLTIPILYLLVNRVFGARTALLAALLLAISPWHIMWSQNGRFYSALMLLYLLTLTAVYFGLEYNRPWSLVAALPLFYFALSERMIAGLAIPVVLVYLLLLIILRFAKPPGLNGKNLLILSIPLIAGLLIELLSLATGGGSRFFGDSGVFVGNAIDSPARILILIFFSIGLPVVILGLFGGGWLMRQRSRPGLFLLVSALLPILLLIGMSPWVFVVERYALITLPAWLVLTAVALNQLFTYLPRQGIWIGLGVVTLLLAQAAGDHLAYYALNNGNRLDWRGAYAYIASHKAADDLAASDRPEIGQYYLDENSTVIDLKEIRVDELTALDQTTWFVVDSHGIWGIPPENKAWLENNADLLFVWYLRVREQIDLKVYRYEPPG